MTNYFSSSKNCNIEVEAMNRFHLANAIKKQMREEVLDKNTIAKMVEILNQKNAEAEAEGLEVAKI